MWLGWFPARGHINLLLDLQQKRGLSYLFVAHDLAVVKYVSHMIAVIYVGRILELADRQSFAEPLHPYSQMAAFGAPAGGVTTSPRRRTVPVGILPSLRNPPSGCHFHTRCPKVRQRCRTEAPVLQTLRGSRKVACHLY